jgi:tetratricopeptide (TPR) repeat protein
VSKARDKSTDVPSFQRETIEHETISEDWPMKSGMLPVRSLLLLLLVVAISDRAIVPAVAQTGDAVSQAQEMIKLGRLDKALELLDPMAAADTEPKGVEYLRGLVLYQQGKLEDAAKAFARALVQDPTDMEAMKMEGASLFREGKAAEAIPLLEKSQGSTNALNVDPQYVLGLCYIDAKRYDDARHAFAAQYEFPPDSASAYLLEGRMLLRRDYVPAAEKAGRKALEIKPDLPMAHLLLGQIALANGDLHEAVSQLVMERDLNPMEGTVYDRLGDAYIRSGDYANAQKALDRAVLLEPTLNIPYILLGKVMLEQNDPLMATMYLKHALEIDPKNSMSHALLGRAYRALGRKDDAVVELRTAAKLQEGNAPAAETAK